MKGLILNNLLSTKSNLMTFTPIMIIIAIVGIGTASEAMYTLVLFFAIFMYPLLYIQCYQKDFGSNWNKLELIMPIKRSSIVLSKYITFFIFLGIGFLVAAIYVMINIVVGNMPWETEMISLFMLMLGMTISAGAFFYPITLALGTEKAETVIIMTFVASAIPLYLAMQVASRYLGLDHMFDVYAHIPFWIGYFIFTIILYVASYFVAQQIYAKKEF